MTTQEFVKKEASKLYNDSDPMSAEKGYSFSDGLSEGIELAKSFAEWYGTLMHMNAITRTQELRTTSELFEIFLTERN